MFQTTNQVWYTMYNGYIYIYKSLLNPITVNPYLLLVPVTTNQLWLTSYFFSCRLSSPVGFPPRYLSFASSGVWPASLGAWPVGTSSCWPFSVVEASATGQRWQGQIKQQNVPKKNKSHVDSSNTKCGAFNNRECEFQMISQVQKGISPSMVWVWTNGEPLFEPLWTVWAVLISDMTSRLRQHDFVVLSVGSIHQADVSTAPEGLPVYINLKGKQWSSTLW